MDTCFDQRMCVFYKWQSTLTDQWATHPFWSHMRVCLYDYVSVCVYIRTNKYVLKEKKNSKGTLFWKGIDKCMINARSRNCSVYCTIFSPTGEIQNNTKATHSVDSENVRTQSQPKILSKRMPILFSKIYTKLVSNIIYYW